MEINLKDLQEKLPYKWKVQSVPKGWKSGQDLDKKASCVAYIDSRHVQNRLDEVVGPENWSSEFYEAKGKLFCKIGIRINGEWVYKSDSGALEGSDFVEAETTSKGESSDAFKRAGVMFGIGRFLYDMEIQWIDKTTYDKYKYKLTEYINSLSKPHIQGNNAPISHDVPQIPSKTKPYITSPIITMKIQDVKEGKIQVSSADSLIELLRKDYIVARDWAEKEIRAKYDAVDKSKQI